jgi:hypothetical protein
MGTAVKKTILLPPDLAREAEEIARAEGKNLSAVIHDALRLARRERLRRELRNVRGYWSRLAKERGILSEKGLERYLAARVGLHVKERAFDRASVGPERGALARKRGGGGSTRSVSRRGG